MVLWFFQQRLSLTAHWHSSWPAGRIMLYENGGRSPNEVFDLNAHVGKLALSLTLWRIGGWSILMKPSTMTDPIERYIGDLRWRFKIRRRQMFYGFLALYLWRTSPRLRDEFSHAKRVPVTPMPKEFRDWLATRIWGKY